MKTTKSLFCLSVLGLSLLTACRTYPDYSDEFRFPIESGNVAEGQAAFIKLGCPQCHVVDGVNLQGYSGQRFITMPLGGELIFAKTYGDLVTSIVNPNHVIDDKYLDQLPADRRQRANTSPMYMNPNMKVTELIDIVAFLNSRYALLPGYSETDF